MLYAARSSCSLASAPPSTVGCNTSTPHGQKGTDIRTIPIRYTAGEAVKRLRQRRLANLYGLWRGRPVKCAEDGSPSSVELLWMPAYAVRAILSHSGRSYNTWVTVDASYGAFALFGRMEALEDTEPQGEIFPPVLGEAEAREIAGDGLVRYVLRKRGAKPSIDSIEEFFLFHSPIWIYYFRRMGGKIDFAVLDAYTGDRAGGRMRQAVINGLIARRRTLRSP